MNRRQCEITVELLEAAVVERAREAEYGYKSGKSGPRYYLRGAIDVARWNLGFGGKRAKELIWQTRDLEAALKLAMDELGEAAREELEAERESGEAEA